jgi:D-glycero-alpha-D-manno-heptose-7-phosphate kinase
VLNATIDRYAYCTIEEATDDSIILEATDLNTTVRLKCDEYPFALQGELLLLKAAYNRMMRKYNGNRPIGLKITTFCDAPTGSGLGTSSTLVVAMVKAFEEFLKVGFDDYQIAHLAYEIERADCKLSGGRQDQYSATFGGFNFMEFYAEDKVLVNPLRIRNWIRCELESSILLHYTGKSRASAKIIDSQVSNFQHTNSKTIEYMHRIKESALLMKDALLKGNFGAFVEYLNLSWESKKKSSDFISNPHIDETIELAKEAGALGAKVSGAGGGGFIMCFVPPENRHKVIESIKDRGEWISNCHFSSEGSQCWTVSY